MVDEIIRLAVLTRVIEQKASMYYHPDLPEGNVRGLPKLGEIIKGHEPLRIAIVKQTMDVLTNGNGSLASAVAPISTRRPTSTRPRWTSHQGAGHRRDPQPS